MKFLDHLEEWLIATLIASATLIIFVSVLHRFASGVPAFQQFTARINMSWAQELCVFLFIWMAKFGAAYGVRVGTHVGVDVLVNRLGPANRKILILIGLVGGIIFTGIVGSLGVNFVWQIAHTDNTSEDMGIPMWIVYMCVPLGSYLMCFRFMQVVVIFLRTGEVPHKDHSHVEGLENVSMNLGELAGNAGGAPLQGPKR